jgi:hypothetical protein
MVAFATDPAPEIERLPPPKTASEKFWRSVGLHPGKSPASPATVPGENRYGYENRVGCALLRVQILQPFNGAVVKEGSD